MLLARRKVHAKELTDQRPDPGRRMTEKEFVDWCGNDTWAEWVDGEVIVMAPVSWDHSDIHGLLYSVIRTFVEDAGLGKVGQEPFQIRLARLRRRRSPDIVYISNAQLTHLKQQQFEGTPDLILEVTSPESQSRDRREKFLEYEAVGVREYWIVDAQSKDFEAYASGKNKKFRRIMEVEGTIRSTVLPRFFLKPTWFKQGTLPTATEVLREMRSKR